MSLLCERTVSGLRMRPLLLHILITGALPRSRFWCFCHVIMENLLTHAERLNSRTIEEDHLPHRKQKVAFTSYDLPCFCPVRRLANRRSPSVADDQSQRLQATGTKIFVSSVSLLLLSSVKIRRTFVSLCRHSDSWAIVVNTLVAIK